MTESLYEIPVTGIDGTPLRLGQFRDKVLLIVNVASRCGYTPQYEGLERLWRRYRDRGLVILGFPCDQFGHQEPGTDPEIREYCRNRWEVTFPLSVRIEVNGRRSHPIYRWLKAARPGLLGSRSIKWNFTKFLVGRDGTVLERFGPAVSPDRLEPMIAAALDQSPVARRAAE